jgi:hypothetical protein
MQVASKDQAIVSKSEETPANAMATLKKAVGNANAALLLWRIVYWCTRKERGRHVRRPRLVLSLAKAMD